MSMIQVSGLSKKFELGVVGATSIRDLFSRAFSSGPKKTRQEFWALRDITFDVQPGEIVGIVGKNGAGKSTLLKILSRITTPTAGRAEINGRVSSLLEVGTGFNPELTGSENIFLNGTILGMSRNEIKQKYEEIVEFSGVEKFLDTPVKHYSSGMYVRLAFAVAAHLEPEVLIIDEVLAVGDAEFQRKCLGKMNEVSKGGRTILFVSHNMSAVMELCTRGILLQQGRILEDGPIDEIVSHYLHAGKTDTHDRSLVNAKSRTGNGEISFTRWDLTDSSGNSIDNAMSGQDIQMHLYFKAAKPGPQPQLHFSLRIVDDFDRNIFHLSTIEGNGDDFRPAADITEGKVVVTIPALPLPPGIYNFHIYCSDRNQTFDEINFAGEIAVEHGNFFGNGKVLDAKWGIVYQKSNWQLYV